MASKLEIEPLPMEPGRARLTVRDGDGSVTDIIEGPDRFIVEQVLRRLDPGTKLALRKVRP